MRLVLTRQIGAGKVYDLVPKAQYDKIKQGKKIRGWINQAKRDRKAGLL